MRELGAKYADAFNRSDTVALAALVTEDFQAVRPDGTITTGRAAFEASEKQQAEQRAGLSVKLGIETKFLKWAGAAHAAVAGTWTMAGVPPGMGADKGAWSAMAEKSADGQWRLSTVLVADDEMPPAGPAAASADPKGKGKTP